MPEAVIVSTARTPIGRAGKGSLVEARPGRPGRLRDPDGARPGAGAAARRDRRRDRRLRLPGGEAGDEPGPPRRTARRPAGNRAGDDGEPVLRVEPAVDPHGLPRDQGRRGRRLRRGGRRVDLAGQRLPEERRGAPPRPVRRRRADRERLHPDGPDRRERGRALERPARGDGPVRAALAGAGGRGPGLRVLRARAERVRRVSRRTTGRAARRRTRSSPRSSRRSSPAAR